MKSKRFLRYYCEVEDGRIFTTKQPYAIFVGNKVVKITRVIFGVFKKVIYNTKVGDKDE